MYARDSSNSLKGDCLQSKEIVNEVLDYFSEMEKRCAGRDALNRTWEATGSWVSWRCTLVECYECIGILKWTIMSIRREASFGGPDFSSLAKWYNKVSRQHALVDTFARPSEGFSTTCSLPQTCWRRLWTQGSDRDNDSSGSVKTEAAAGTFKQQ